MKSIQKNSEKNIDIDRLTNFCRCELDMVKTRKLSDAEMANTSNPNSPLFYEMIQKCGDPFSDAESSGRNWNPDFEKDINGPAIDTLRTLTINGMTYLRIKIGSMEQIWLFDTGASELLINREMEIKLKEEKIMSDKDYLGTAEYEMANGMIDTCRKYKINNIQIGKFTINNINVAVTDKGKKIIAGKGLLNKFSYWQLDNRNNALILNK